MGTAASGEICRNYRLREFLPRFQGNGRDGQSRSLHRYRLRDFTDKVGPWSDGIVGTMESDSILVFVRTLEAVDAFHEGVMPELGLQCVILLKR
jgi:hypothetical protein